MTSCSTSCVECRVVITVTWVTLETSDSQDPVFFFSPMLLCSFSSGQRELCLSLSLSFSFLPSLAFPFFLSWILVNLIHILFFTLLLILSLPSPSLPSCYVRLSRCYLIPANQAVLCCCIAFITIINARYLPSLASTLTLKKSDTLVKTSGGYSS